MHRSDTPASAYIAGAIFLLVTVPLGGLAYWSSHHSITAAECVYGNADCSVAAATWSLCAITIAAFIAAYQAATWAKRAYNLEVDARLGQKICVDKSPNHLADVSIYLTQGGGVIPREPLGFDAKEYFPPQHHAFNNLGRVALANVVAYFRFEVPSGERSSEIAVRLGNIRAGDNESHITIYKSSILYESEPAVVWIRASAEGITNLKFFLAPRQEELSILTDREESPPEIYRL